MKKKLLSLLLVFALVLSCAFVLASCGGDDPDDSDGVVDDGNNNVDDGDGNDEGDDVYTDEGVNGGSGSKDVYIDTDSKNQDPDGDYIKDNNLDA